MFGRNNGGEWQERRFIGYEVEKLEIEFVLLVIVYEDGDNLGWKIYVKLFKCELLPETRNRARCDPDLLLELTQWILTEVGLCKKTGTADLTRIRPQNCGFHPNLKMYGPDTCGILKSARVAVAVVL
ncbi:hypothetical protein C5167_017293 [Papaver somniferum]|uniref:Uncharacterized protein n=1 Tax=Papaver somniferum TaxID=3469 RepID=A0A4Y7IJ00_PAPSO|nr:hypothetical protein C5167_017293 [Papaver somniferum]